MPKDHKPKKLNKNQLEIANVLRYLDERMLNLVEQVRSAAILSGRLNGKSIQETAEEFQKIFRDPKIQDDFFVKLHVAEDLYEAEERAKSQKEQPKVQISEEIINNQQI